MNTVYQESYITQSTDLNMFGKLRSVRLLELVQQVSGRHAEALGMGEESLMQKNLVWVVVRQRLVISRMPAKGETLHFTTWPGRSIHGLFPRYMEITTDAGESLVKLCFLWVIMDYKTRTMIHPALYGLDMPFADREPLLPLPRMPKTLLPASKTVDFTVPFGYIDIVGHMNNTRYLELAENLIPAPGEGLSPRDILIEFTHELKLGETMQVEIGQEGGRFHLHGVKGEQSIITLCLEYS